MREEIKERAAEEVRQEILRSIADTLQIAPEPIMDNEFTVTHASREWRMGWDKTKALLKKLVEDGELEMRENVLCGTHYADVYRWIRNGRDDV